MSIFRGLPVDKNDSKKIDGLVLAEIKPVLEFQRNYRKSVIVEIRKNYLDLYFLGHAIKVAPGRSGYCLEGSDEFIPDGFKWPVLFKDIKGKFEEFMLSVMSEIVRHKKGNISEGVSEMNHYVDNRDYRNVAQGGILIIDRQVSFKGLRIDLLGVKKLNNNKFTFVIIELKNKQNKEIEAVFSQTKDYLDILWEYYDDFRDTYSLILNQKIQLRLLDRKNKGEIAEKSGLSRDKIEGIVILDNYNLLSNRLRKSLKDWKQVNKFHNIKLFLKTNTLDSRFFQSYEQAQKLFK